MASTSLAGTMASSPSSSPAPVPAKRSVKDLLAELSDSDSDTVQQTSNRLHNPSVTSDLAEQENESSEDDVLIGGGRLAARLMGKISSVTASADHQVPQTNLEKFATSSDSDDELSKSPAQYDHDDADSEAFRPKRKLLLKRKRPVIDNDLGSPRSSRADPSTGISPSPKRHPSPPPPQVGASPSDPSPGRSDLGSSTGKSKFQALVEKARRERLAREEAEAAKIAAREARQALSSPREQPQRGTSPADGSEEDSDRSEVLMAKKLTSSARPTRKASKKALEEMNRETQRMNRNMQLAHQAKTKKKFTKESFFAAFTRSKHFNADHAQVASSSSALSSDTDNAALHSTPPTSPLIAPESEKIAIAAPVEPMEVEDIDDDDVPDLGAIIAARRAEAAAKDQLRIPLNGTGDVVAQTILDPALEFKQESDSGSDVEVVFEKGLKRKYAAFENLPKKKAKETGSHLALRSLAHLKHEKDAKSSMSRADMGPALLRAARKQAQEERKAKIDKLKAKGVIIQTEEEREQEQEQLEDLVERARQEDEQIRKREKQVAKKEGTYTKDALDDEDSDDEDDEFDPDDHGEDSGSEDGEDGNEGDEEVNEDEPETNALVDDVADESEEESPSETEAEELVEGNDHAYTTEPALVETPVKSRIVRRSRFVVDDDDDDDNDEEKLQVDRIAQSPALPSARKTPQSILKSARKVIPGLQNSDDLPLGLTQAFAATMADSQTQAEDSIQEQDSMNVLQDLPSPHIGVFPRLNRLESLDMISESVAGSQTQPMDLNLDFSQDQRVPESPAMTVRLSQAPFELTQDAGYSFSPFSGNRFAETPSREPHSTEETLILQRGEDSPIVSRKGRLQRGRHGSEDLEGVSAPNKSAFQVMDQANKRRIQEEFNKKKSQARQAVDEAAEESDDEYAGLGGASDDESGEENEDDRKMIDEDTQVGKGDEAKLAKLHADRERETDEAAVSKLLKDITTGALRRKRGAADDLDLSDEEDAAARRREAKRREFARMRRELLKDEAVGKIAEDKKKEAFLKSIEDRDEDEDDNDFDQPDTSLNTDSQDQPQQDSNPPSEHTQTDARPLRPANESQLNISVFSHRRAKAAVSQRPGTLAEIRESVSFLIEEPDSQAGTVDLGLSDSEDEPEAYVNLDRHLQQAEADEDEENEDLGDFVVDDDDSHPATQDATFKKPELPSKGSDRAPFSERRTKSVNVIDRLSLLRQASSSSTGSNPSSKPAFFSSKSGSGTINGVPSLLRRATTNSSLGSISSRDNVSATGVVTSKTERGSAVQEKEFVRKGSNTSRNAINYQGRQNLKEEKMSARAGIVKKQQQKKKGGGFLSGLFRGDTWG